MFNSLEKSEAISDNDSDNDNSSGDRFYDE